MMFLTGEIKKISKYCKWFGNVLYLDCLECETKYCRGYKDGKSRNDRNKEGSSKSDQTNKKKNKENTMERKSMEKKKIVIGIDQSYQDTGIAIGCEGRIMNVTDCFTKDLQNNSVKRKELNLKLSNIFSKMSLKVKSGHYKVIVIIERIRLQSQGFINIDYIKSIGALNAMIVDLAKEYDFPVYSVDTRAWKSNVIGTSKELNNKYGIDPKKWPTILWCINHGYEDYIINYNVGKRKKGILFTKDGTKYSYNDNRADSIGICLYGFIPKNKQNLKEEH